MENKNESNETKLAVIQNTLSFITEAVKAVDKKVSAGYVTKEEFKPVRIAVYGLVGLILVAVVGAILSQVIK